MLLLFSSIVACSNGDGKDAEQLVFKEQKQILGKQVLADHFKISKIYAADQFIFSILNNDDYYFEIFDARSLNSLGKFGRKGRGPQDIMGPVRYSGFKSLVDAVVVSVYDRNSLELINISIPKSFSIDKIKIKRIPLSPKASFLNLFPIDEKQIIGTVSNMDVKMDRLRIYDIEENAITKRIPLFPEIPKISEDLSHITSRYNGLFTGPSDFSHEQKKFVVALSKLNRIDIFNNKGELERSILDQPNNSSAIIEDYLRTDNVLNTDIKIFYQDIKINNNYIYTIYYNHFYKDFQNPKPVEVRVFDWQGNPIMKYMIKEYLTQFTVNKNNTLYGIDADTRNIYKYDLNPLSND